MICSRGNEQQNLLTLLQQHLEWYPAMQVQDVYKLIFQGTMGPEHMVATRQEFTRSLEDEFANLDPALGHLLEPIRSDQALYRLNLRPYKIHHRGVSALISPLLNTSKQYPGDKTRLIATWDDFIELCKQGKLVDFAADIITQFSHWLKREAYPAVHHSEAYRQAYQPAYRLIMSKFAAELKSDAAS